MGFNLKNAIKTKIYIINITNKQCQIKHCNANGKQYNIKYKVLFRN